ncbi:MAG: glycosyltransferase family 9 protein [Candidatus Pacearchaeota archaeon]|jgi:heptosyltransferase-2
MTHKICIIKLGALGDVVRTTPILLGIKEKYPDAEITWITKPESLEILEDNPHIQQILTIPVEGIYETFDMLYNFDLEEEALALASIIQAREKFGYYNEEGFPAPFNSAASYYLETTFSDELKKTNKKTYQEMMFEIAELEYKRQPCFFYLTDLDKRYADEFAKDNNLNTKKLVGINIGASKRWPSKSWSVEKIKELIETLNKKGYEILLLGGRAEKDNISELINHFSEKDIRIFQNNVENSIKQFASLINLCKKVVSGDTMALHLAIALKKPTVGLFFCTSPDEIEDYGLLFKCISPMLKEFFPERSDQYDEKLVNSISSEQVFEALERV